MKTEKAREYLEDLKELIGLEYNDLVWSRILTDFSNQHNAELLEKVERLEKVEKDLWSAINRMGDLSPETLKKVLPEYYETIFQND